MKRFVSALLLLILFGCVYPPMEQKEPPKATYKEGVPGKIVVARISSFAAVLIDYEVEIDGIESFLIGSGKYAEFTLPPGEHFIALRWIQWGFFVGRQYEQTLEFVLEDSQTIYFLVSPWSLKGAKIQLSNETEAKKHIEQGRLINLKK